MKRAFLKYVKNLEEDELRKELQKLYTKFPTIKKYYEMELSPTTDKVMAEYKAKIKKEYFKPSGSFGRAKSSVTRKYITEFKKISIYPSDVVELWVYRTELMVKYVKERNYYNDGFYKSTASSFETACKLIIQEKMETEYQNRCYEIVNTVYDFWGLPEELQWIYEKYFDKFIK